MVLLSSLPVGGLALAEELHDEEVDGDDYDGAVDRHDEGGGAEDEGTEMHALVVLHLRTLVEHRVGQHRREQQQEAAREAL